MRVEGRIRWLQERFGRKQSIVLEGNVTVMVRWALQVQSYCYAGVCIPGNFDPNYWNGRRILEELEINCDFHKSAKNFRVLPRVYHTHMRKSSMFESTPNTWSHRSKFFNIPWISLGERYNVSCPRGRNCIRKAVPAIPLLLVFKFKKAYRLNTKNKARIIAYTSSFVIKCGGRGSVVIKIP